MASKKIKKQKTQTETVAKAEWQAFIDLLEQRAKTYGLLSRLYRREIDQGFLDELKKMRYPANTGNANIDKGYLMIVTYLSNLWSDSLTELSIDYAKTFIGYGSDTYSAAYPFESVHTSEMRLLMQDARDEVLAKYAKSGLAKQKSFKEAEDHISLEMDYMIILNERTIEALRSGDEEYALHQLFEQKEFLANHLYAWVPMMTSDVRRIARTEFYHGLAWLTDGFLETDFEFLEDMAGED